MHNPNPNMKYLLLPLMLGSLVFSACDSKEVKEEKSANKEEAKAIDKQADATRDKAAADAHEVKAAGEAKAKAMENAADTKRDDNK